MNYNLQSMAIPRWQHYICSTDQKSIKMSSSSLYQPLVYADVDAFCSLECNNALQFPLLEGKWNIPGYYFMIV